MLKKIKICLVIIIAILIGVIMFSFLFKNCGLNVGSTIKGFRIVEKELVDNNGRKDTILTLKHEKTDALVTYIINNDPHRFFSISFNVPTMDKTGVAHIIEHAVLSSSRKYKDTDLFFNLAKKTPATFLNAGTDEGQVYYYFQTINNQDFMNLMDIYMEASLFPELSKRIFQKEGWRLRIDENENLSYNGVVYNEMKTAYSKPMYHWRYAVMNELMKGEEFESGGNPQFITDLTYENFRDRYRKTHNPSNAFVVFYGNGDIKSELEFLDKEFSEFEKQDKVVFDYKNKSLEKPSKIITSYPVGKGEENSIMVFGYLVGDVSDVVLTKKLNVLKFLLTEYEEAPLKKVFLEQNLLSEISIEWDRVKDKQAVYIVLVGVKKHNEEKIEKLLNETLLKLSKTGFGEVAEDAGKAIQKFELKEEDRFEFVKGEKIYNMYMTYLFGGDYKKLLKNEEFYNDFMEQTKDKNIWKDLVKDLFVDNNKKTEVILRPDEKMFDKFELETKNRLDKIKANMSKQDLQDLKRENAEFDEMDKQVLEADFPVLSMKQWSDQKILIDADIKDYNGAKVILHDLKTSGITQFIFAFNMSNVDEDKLGAIGVYDLLSDKLDTRNYSNEDFVLKQSIIMGREFETDAIISPNYKDDKLVARYVINVQSFEENSEKALRLLEEFIFNIKYTDEKKIKEIVVREVEKYEMIYRQKGYPIFEDYSKSNYMISYMSGSKQYEYLKKLLKNWDSEYGKLLLDLNYLKNNLFVRDNLIVDIVGNKDDKKEAEKFLDILSLKDIKPKEYAFDLKKNNQARIASARNNENYMWCKLDLKERWLASFSPQFITYNYLTQEVRIKGGAYGSVFSINPDGIARYWSYSDPNIKNTFDVFKKSGEFFEGFSMKEKDFEAVKIKVLAKYLSPRTVFEEGDFYLKNFLLKLSEKDLEEDYEKIKSLKVQDISKVADLLKSAKDCVIGTAGPESQINENKSLYDEVK